MKIDPNSPVSFGQINLPQGTIVNTRLTIRAYFASMAMQGILSDPNRKNFCYEYTTKECIEYADELIKQINND